MSTIPTQTTSSLAAKVAQANEKLDAWVREVVAWHFDPATGCPFWLEFASQLDWDPRKEIRSFEHLQRFGLFQDEMAARRAGTPLDSARVCRPPDLHLRDRRKHRGPQEPDQR